MNDLAQFQPAFNGVNTLLAVITNIETEQITNGNFKLKGNSSFDKCSASNLHDFISKRNCPITYNPFSKFDFSLESFDAVIF
jgi:hypothetical protein